jgi:hypothetical protein
LATDKATDPAAVPANPEAPAEAAEGQVGAEQTTPEPAEPLATDKATETTSVAPEAPAAPVEGAPVEGQIVLQSEDSFLTTDLLGTTVFSTTDESIGDINDLIVNLDGTVEGVVIGVGGFLGIGEKEVALEMAKLDLVTRDSGEVRLVLNSSRAELEAAPEFKSAYEQNRDREYEQLQSQAGTGTPPAAPGTPPQAPTTGN